jgi:RelA/SpoT family (p)ppGpp synthetase
LKDFLDKVKNITTIEEADNFLSSCLPSMSYETKKALELAKKSHAGQVRVSGVPYIIHPILAASITAHISNDETMVQAALLHDVVEDTLCELKDIEATFGKDITRLVEGLTKIVEIRGEELAPSNSDEKLIKSALSFRKMLIASISDVRVLVIKLCDRLHNMLTLDALSAQKQKRIAEETLVVYAPIAHRLGISKLKNALEDLSFYYIYPDDYKEIDRYIEKNRQGLQLKLNSIISKIKTVLAKDGIKADRYEILGRVKHYYSIYLKMQRKGISIDEVLDLLAVRIILKKPLDCYKALGSIHLNFTPLISRFKDYIALPKENGYQTIHTMIFDEAGIVEVQIRTEKMHQFAEYGVAAHWKYKGDINLVKLEWLESLKYQSESVEEFYELAKGDLFSEDISVFSPKGDYYTLPKDSVALDFAYRIHTHLGATATDALINKEKVSLLTPLKNGDIINIIRGQEVSLHCSWINAVKTSRAKEGIKSICKARIKENDQKAAYLILATIFNISLKGIMEIVSKMGYSDTIYRASTQLDSLKEVLPKIALHMGTREVSFWEILKRGYKKPTIKKIDNFSFYTNKSISNVEFDFCCHPKTNDQIVAFVEKDTAIIHHKLCKKAYEKIKSEDAMLFVEWIGNKLFRYRLIIGLQNHKGALAKLLTQLSKMELNVVSIELSIYQSDRAEYCQIEVESRESKKKNLETKIKKVFNLIEIISLDDAYNG